MRLWERFDIVAILIEHFQNTYLAFVLSNVVSKRINKTAKLKYYRPLYEGELPIAKPWAGGTLYMLDSQLLELPPSYILQRGRGVLKL